LEDLILNVDEVRQHILILFNAEGYSLLSVRAVVLDSALNIVCESSWNSYIRHEDSLIADKVEDTDGQQKDPTRGLSLTSKANARQNGNVSIVETNQEEENHLA
jgi:hypothetical protein